MFLEGGIEGQHASLTIDQPDPLQLDGMITAEVAKVGTVDISESDAIVAGSEIQELTDVDEESPSGEGKEELKTKLSSFLRQCHRALLG